MTAQRRQAAAGTVVSYYATEERVYLKIAIEDQDGHHLGWAKGVTIDRETLKRYLSVIDQRLNDALQMELPWEDPAESSSNVRFMPPQL